MVFIQLRHLVGYNGSFPFSWLMSEKSKPLNLLRMISLRLSSQAPVSKTLSEALILSTPALTKIFSSLTSLLITSPWSAEDTKTPSLTSSAKLEDLRCFYIVCFQCLAPTSPINFTRVASSFKCTTQGNIRRRTFPKDHASSKFYHFLMQLSRRSLTWISKVQLQA